MTEEPTKPQASDPLPELLAFYDNANFLFRITLMIVALWPLTVIALAVVLPPQAAQTIVPIVDLVPLFAAFLFVLSAPFGFAILLRNQMARRGLLWLAAAIGVELSIGVYFSTIPVSKDAGLVPILLLTALAMFFLRIGGIAKWLIRIFAFMLVAITLVFLLGGRQNVKDYFDKVITKMEQPPVAQPPAPTSSAAPTPTAASITATTSNVSPVVSQTTPNPSAPPTTIDQPTNDSPSYPPDTVPVAKYESGPLDIYIGGCSPQSTQLRCWGEVKISDDAGDRDTLVVFHRFTVQDESGRLYQVSQGDWGITKTLGMGYAWNKIPSGTAVPFRITIDQAASAKTLTISMPSNHNEDAVIVLRDIPVSTTTTTAPSSTKTPASAPTTDSTSSSPQLKPIIPDWSTAIQVTDQNLTFLVPPCILRAAIVHCFFRISNQGDEAKVRIHDRLHRPPTRLIDDQGNQYQVTEVTFGSDSSQANIPTDLPSGITIMGSASFENVVGTHIALFEIGWDSGNVYYSNSVQFRDLNIESDQP